MHHSRLLMLFPALALVLAIGCGKPAETPGPVKGDGDGKQTKNTGKSKKEPLEVKETGSLKGKVTFMGEPPAPKSLKDEMNKDTDHCLKGDVNDPTWIIGADKGVADVVVWVQPAGDKYFVVPEGKRKADKEVVIDQPFCRFRPNVVAVYPSYYDPTSKKFKETGEKFVIKNSAPISHNTNWHGDQLINSGKNEIIPTGSQMAVNAVPGRVPGNNDLLEIKCDIHKWMKGWARVFDHPYFAVTSGDEKDAKEFGTYEIKDVPAGVELELVYWHPSMGMDKPKVLKKFKVGAGETVDMNFEIK